MPSTLKILFIDDHSGLRDGLAFLLSQKNPDLQFFSVSTMEEALKVLKETQDIGTVILDLNLNGKDGLLVLSELRKINPGLNVLVYTMFNDPIHIEKAINADIQGYVTKEIDIEEFEKAIISVSRGNNYYNKQASSVMHSIIFKNSRQETKADYTTECFKNYKSLTKKEQEVFQLLAQKKEVYEIAEILGKSEKTVINQRAIIYQKMAIRDRLELIEAAAQLGVIL